MTSSPVVEDGATPISVFQSDLPIDEKLDRARTELLDLSARNRLLNMPRSSKAATLLIVSPIVFAPDQKTNSPVTSATRIVGKARNSAKAGGTFDAKSGALNTTSEANTQKPAMRRMGAGTRWTTRIQTWEADSVGRGIGFARMESPMSAMGSLGRDAKNGVGSGRRRLALLVSSDRGPAHEHGSSDEEKRPSYRAGAPDSHKHIKHWAPREKRSELEQREVWANARTPDKVNWPAW